MTLFVARRSSGLSFLVVLFALSCVAPSAWGQASKPQGSNPHPTVWMAPPGQDNCRAFRELFEKPEPWKQTRALIDVLLITDLNLKRHFSDEELGRWFPMLDAWEIKLAMEVGAVKPWGLTGEKTFNIEKPNWDRIQRLGGKIYAIAMDEPLICCRKHIHKPDDYAVQETASYIALVRKHFPQILIGDIETYPSLSIEENIAWIEALQQRLSEMHVRGLDFYRLDVDWVTYTMRNVGSWREVKKLEQYCRARKLQFSLIYWASGYPALQRKGLADDSTWYTAIMQQGYDYALVDGAPDQYVIESWVKAPSRCLPETDPFTFTHSVLDFTRKFVKQPELGK